MPQYNSNNYRRNQSQKPPYTSSQQYSNQIPQNQSRYYQDSSPYNSSHPAQSSSQDFQRQSRGYGNSYSKQNQYTPSKSNDLTGLELNVADVNTENVSTLFHGGTTSSRQTELLTESPVEFLCNHYEITADVREVLSARFQNALTKTDREQIYSESYNDIVEVLDNHECMPVSELRNDYVKILIADVVGYGVLEDLLNDPEVTEIMVASHDRIFIEKNGKQQYTDVRFPSVENAVGIAKRIVEPLGKRLDTVSPNVDAQMKDGSRLSASIPPIRLNNEVSITIRKPSDQVYPLRHYADKYKSETLEMVEFLERIVRAKQSMIISGGTGSGKTTLLNSVALAIPDDERILTLEDTPELRMSQPNVEGYQTIDPNLEGKGGTTMGQLMINALRKRPDRIIVGECRGKEITEMLNAMNTGHEGSLSTIHANSPSEMVIRAAGMIRKDPDNSTITERAIADTLNAIDVIVQTNKLQDGSRKVINITEVLGVGQDGVDRAKARGVVVKGNVENSKLYLQDIFRFRQTGVGDDGKVHGVFETTGYVPYCNDALRVRGEGYPDNFFRARVLMEV